MNTQLDSHFHTIIKASSDGIVVVDMNGVIRFVNPATEVLFQRESCELLGSMFGFPITSDTTTELDIVRKGGTVTIAEMRVVEIDWGGEIAHLALLRDITERKQAQDELRALYNAITYLFKADSLPDLCHQIALAVVQEFKHVDCGVLLLDKKQNKIIRVARAGIHKIEVCGDLQIDDLGLVPESIRTGNIIYAPDVRCDPRYVATYPKTRSELVIPLCHVNGTQDMLGVLDLQSTQVNAFTNAQQRILLAFAERATAAIVHMQLYENINLHANELEWHVSQRTSELQQAKEQIESILNSSSDAIILTSPDGAIEHVNPSVETHFEYAKDELIGESVFKLANSKAVDTIFDTMSVLVNKFLPQTVEITGKKKNGGLFDGEIAFSPVIIHDEIKGIVCNIRDITKRKQMEEKLRSALSKEKELNLLKTNFVSMVSHDFRTPLTVIQTSTQLLQRYINPTDLERREQQLNKIQVQIDRMVALLEDVLIINQDEIGTTPFTPLPTDINRLCEELATEFQTSSNMRHKLWYRCSPGPSRVDVDEKLLQRALINLLTNAFKYSPEGSTVCLELSFDKDNMIISVKDNGIGIPENDQPHLFETFHRASNVGTVSGTGLGLAIVKQAIEAHNGTITVQSRENIGTTFILRIPIRSRSQEVKK